MPEDRHVELYRLAGQQHVATSADDRGRLHVQTIDVRIGRVAEKLRVEVDGAACEI